MNVVLVTPPVLEPMILPHKESRRKRQIGIYQILCKPTGKVYIGSAVNLTQRKGDHRKSLRAGDHHSQYLQRAWNKYGNDAFEFSVLEYCEKEKLTKLEQVYIDLLKAADREHGFNINPIAGSALGYKHTQEAKRKISEKVRGCKRTIEMREKMSASRMGKKLNLSPAQSKKRSRRMIGNGWNLGRKHTEETKAKLRGNKNAANYTRTEEYRNNLSIAHHPFGSEQCSEIREAYVPGIVTMKELASKYGCNRQTIGNIINHNLRAYQ